MSNLKRSFGYLRPYTKEAILAVVLLGLVVAANLSIPRARALFNMKQFSSLH